MIILLPVAAILSGVLWLLPAFRFLRRYEQRLTSPTSEVSRRDIKLPQVQLHIYSPRESSESTLIIVPGLHPEGIYDKRFVAFAETCAEAGFHVIAPDLKEFRSFQITNESVQILHTIIEALPAHLPAESRKKLGILGISYGAGPAFLVAAEKNFDFIVSIGGYYNLLHALQYSFTGVHPDKDQKRRTHEWGRLIFALNHIEELASEQDREILRESLDMRLKLKEEDAEMLEKKLSPDGQSMMQGILKGLSDEQEDAFIRILHRREEEALQLSPAAVLSRISPETRIYLLHGTGDDSVPFEETEELNIAFEKAGLNPRTLITPALTHVDFTKVSELWELVKLLHWERLLLRER